LRAWNDHHYGGLKKQHRHHRLQDCAMLGHGSTLLSWKILTAIVYREPGKSKEKRGFNCS
jgi:hypothetical protein